MSPRDLVSPQAPAYLVLIISPNDEFDPLSKAANLQDVHSLAVMFGQPVNKSRLAH